MAYRAVEEVVGAIEPAFVPLEVRAGRVSSTVLLDLVRAGDVAIILLASLIAGTAYLGWFWQPEAPAAASYTVMTLVGGALASLLLAQLGVYRVERLRLRGFQVFRSLSGWTITIVVLIVAAFLFKISESFSRGWLLLWWSCGGLGLFGFRLAVRPLADSMIMRGRLSETVAVVGTPRSAAKVLERLDFGVGAGSAFLGCYTDSHDGSAAEGAPFVGTLDDLVSLAQQRPIDKVIISLPMDDVSRIEAVVRRLRTFPCDVMVGLHQLDRLNPTDVRMIGGVPAARVSRKPLEDWQVVWKGVEDKVVAGTVLLVFWPVLLLCALAIRLESPGPVIFSQRRFGFNNKPVTIYKLRTMYAEMGDPAGGQQTIRNDPRVTRVGRVLRRTNLDELPQFINVLQGRLSVVGPRPHALTMRAADRLYHEAVAEYADRHKVRPGVTGWAQVNGLRGETDTIEKARRRVEYDLYYIDNWSLVFDLKILLLTLLRGFRDPNAY